MGIEVSVPCWWEKAGWSVAQVQRVRRNEGLKVPSKPKRESRRGDSTGLLTKATYPNQVWTWDLIFDRTDKGSTLKMLTMLDEYTRQCLVIRVERQIQSRQVFETLLQVMPSTAFLSIYAAITALSLLHTRFSKGSKRLCCMTRLKRVRS